jgi:hypothetical protein
MFVDAPTAGSKGPAQQEQLLILNRQVGSARTKGRRRAGKGGHVAWMDGDHAGATGSRGTADGFRPFGATGDLARRMVLPGCVPAGVRGLLPRQWLLVGNGRGDIAHESFRARVHDALTEFGPKPEGRDWDSFAQRLFFAGGGFSSGSPGSLLDVLGEARASLGGSPRRAPGRPGTAPVVRAVVLEMARDNPGWG